MSTSWPRPDDRELAVLRGHDNPFDEFVQARHPSGSFRRRHVEAVNRAAWEKLLATVERYRLDCLDVDLQTLTRDDVPRSGVLLVLGPRGAGKTHLVHALRLHAAGALVIAPTQFEPHRPFSEYLLQLLVRALQEPANLAGTAALRRLADWFARHAACQALYGMTDTQWLARQARREGRYWRGLLSWGSRAVADRRELLIKSLLDANFCSIAEVCRFREHVAEEVQQIAFAQIEATETDPTIGGQIRRGLYLHLVQLAFSSQTEPLLDFLADGFTRIEAPLPPSRNTMVEELLAALSELLLLCGTPVIFAFDALETLLSDPPDAQRCHAFFRGLAEVLDSHRGLPFLLFAEAGHWEQAQRYISSYALQRLQQGVPTRGHGSLRQVSLPAISVEDLEQLVAARMAGKLESARGESATAMQPIRPFSHADLMAIARSGPDAPPLRQMLQALRDLYQERVFGDTTSTGVGVPSGPGESSTLPRLDPMDVWRREYKAAERRLQAGNLQAEASALQIGLQTWLTCLAREGASLQSWAPQEADSVAFGDSPTFGHLTRARWRNGQGERVGGIAFLLGQKASMPRDLREKLRMMASPRPVTPSLVIAWPHPLECAGPAEKHLPPATRKVWDEFVTGPLADRVALRAVDRHALACWLAVEPWLAALREEADLGPDAVQHFLAEETGDLLAWVLPPTPIEQQEPAHECVAGG